MTDYMDPATNFAEKHYLSPKLSIAVDYFHGTTDTFPVGDIQHISIIEKRTDLIDFERDIETDGDWIISNINEII